MRLAQQRHCGSDRDPKVLIRVSSVASLGRYMFGAIGTSVRFASVSV